MKEEEPLRGHGARKLTEAFPNDATHFRDPLEPRRPWKERLPALAETTRTRWTRAGGFFFEGFELGSSRGGHRRPTAARKMGHRPAYSRLTATWATSSPGLDPLGETRSHPPPHLELSEIRPAARATSNRVFDTKSVSRPAAGLRCASCSRHCARTYSRTNWRLSSCTSRTGRFATGWLERMEPRRKPAELRPGGKNCTSSWTCHFAEMF